MIETIIKMRKNSIYKFSFRVFAFILTFFLFSCQFFPQLVYAEAIPVGQPVNAGDLWTVIEGSGPEQVPVKDPFIMSVELSTLFGLGTLAQDAFWQETNAVIAQKVQNGTLNSSDVGQVFYKEVDGQQVPVAVVNSIYGQNMYFITDDLARKIRDENIQRDEDIKNAVLDYWERVIISDVQPFQEAVAVADNWICNLGGISGDIQDIVASAMFNLFGTAVPEPLGDFLQTGIACSVYYNTSSVRNIRVSSSALNSANKFLVLRISDVSYQGTNYDYFVSFVHYSSESNPYLFTSSGYDAIRSSDIRYVVPNVQLTTITYQKAVQLFGQSFPPFSNLDTALLNDMWPLIVHIPDVAPAITPGVHYNVGNVVDSVNNLAVLADDAISAGTDAGGNPEYTPDSLPTIDPDEVPGVLPDPYPDPWPQEFPDEYPDPAPWIDPDSNPYPKPDPDPNPDPDPDPDDPTPDPTPDSGDNGWHDPPPERPTLKTPALLTLFPFCIPFDIKSAIEWFGNDNSDPIFSIPIVVNIGGNTIVNYQLIINLTKYGIDVLCGYLKTVQLIAYVIVLGYATAKVIY